MSRQTHAACRASLEPSGWVLRVSRATPHRWCVRSLSQLSACSGCRRTRDSHSCPGQGPASHIGDDLACLVAQNLRPYLR